MTQDAPGALVWLASLWLAGTAIFGLAALLELGLRRRSAALRRELWALALAVALVLPLARLALAAPELRPPPLLAAALLAVWVAGAALLLLRLARAHARARRLLAAAAPLTDPEWRRDLTGFDGHVSLYMSEEADTPCALGVLRPAIVVPRRMLGLPAPERRALLAHELAHVARADCLLQLAGALARALYWVSPLAWWALRRLRALAEDAADDAVLRAGISSSSYAAQLLALARASRARVREGLRRRIVAILDARRVRGRPHGWSVPRLAGAAVLIASLATACEARSDSPAPQPVARP